MEFSSIAAAVSGGLLLLGCSLVLWDRLRKKSLERRQNSRSILQELETMPLSHESDEQTSPVIRRYNELRSSLLWYQDQQKTLDRFTETYRTLVKKEHYIRFIAWCLSRNAYQVEMPGLTQNCSLPLPEIIARNDSEILLILTLTTPWTAEDLLLAQRKLADSKALYESNAENNDILKIRTGIASDKPLPDPPGLSEHDTSAETAFAELKLFPLLHFYPGLLGKQKSLFAPGESDYDRLGLTKETLCFYTLAGFESHSARHYGTLPNLELDEDFLKLLLLPEKGTIAPSPYKQITSEGTAEEKKSFSSTPLQTLLDQASASLPAPDSSSF